MADLGALQRLQQGLRGELSCDWPQVQPLQLVQHSINIAPCRFIRKQLTFNRLNGQQHVEKTSVRTNTIEEVKKEHCFAACVPGKLEDSQPFISPCFDEIQLIPWVLAVVGNSRLGIAGLTHMTSVDVCWILVAASRECITVGENPACYESHTYCKL